MAQIRTIRGGGAAAEDRDQHGSNRSMCRSTRLVVADLVQRRVLARSCRQPKAIRRRIGRAVGEHVYWEVPGMTQHQFEDRWRPRAWRGRAERSWRSAHCQVHTTSAGPLERAEELGAPWEIMPKRKKMLDATFFGRYITWAIVQETRSLPCMQVVPRYTPGGHTDTCRSRFWRIWADENSIKATAEAVKDARQASSSATTTVTFSAAHFIEWTSSSSSDPAHHASSSSAADTTISAEANHAAEPVYALSAPRKTAPWSVPAEDVLMQPSQWDRLGWALERRILDGQRRTSLASSGECLWPWRQRRNTMLSWLVLMSGEGSVYFGTSKTCKMILLFQRQSVHKKVRR